MKRCIYKNLIFIACDYLSIMIIGEEGYKIVAYDCITLLPRVDRDYSNFYFAKVKKGNF